MPALNSLKINPSIVTKTVLESCQEHQIKIKIFAIKVAPKAATRNDEFKPFYQVGN